MMLWIRWLLWRLRKPDVNSRDVTLMLIRLYPTDIEIRERIKAELLQEWKEQEPKKDEESQDA